MSTPTVSLLGVKNTCDKSIKAAPAMVATWNESLLAAEASNAEVIQQAYATFNAVVPTDQTSFETWLENQYEASHSDDSF